MVLYSYYLNLAYALHLVVSDLQPLTRPMGTPKCLGISICNTEITMHFPQGSALNNDDNKKTINSAVARVATEFFPLLCDLAEVVFFCMYLCYKYLTSPRSAGERHILDDLSEVGYL